MALQLPELNSRHLLLRPPVESDVTAFAKLAAAKEIAENTLVPHPYDIEMAHDYFRVCEKNREKGSGANFVIILRESNEIIGSISYKDISRKHRRAEFGYWIGKPYWNNGYATEAIKALIRYGFEELNLHRIYATPFGENEASKRVLEKAGMNKEGVLKDHLYHRGKFKDFVMYGMTEDRYVAKKL